LLGQGKLRRAISDLSWSITLRPHVASAYYHRAHVYRRLGDTEKADADLERALQLDPLVGWRQ
jgi:Flp pilus assembly protein TadD